MKTKTNTKAGIIAILIGKSNHNESMKVRSNVKAGDGKATFHDISISKSIDKSSPSLNHNESMKVRSNVKAGLRRI